MKPSEFWEWAPDDQAHALALQEFEASLNSLGIPIDEATSPHADANNRKHGRYYYTAETVLDHSLLAEKEARDALKDDPQREAKIVRVRRVERRPS